jgi:hypothetical protein
MRFFDAVLVCVESSTSGFRRKRILFPVPGAGHCMAQSPNVGRQRLIIRTVDDFPIVLTHFKPPASLRKQAVVVIGNATGVHAKFYHDFAS